LHHAASRGLAREAIKVMVGYAPGGSTDVVARLIAPKLGEKLGQPIVIENKRAAPATSPRS
jgi:tripartite-type tricarboxylate transporter receptor subunit TctC